jgi:tetratricopeptide (TPR) repeat protein
MKKVIFSLGILLLITLTGTSQEQDPKKLHETAKTYMRQGDYSNAVLILNRILQNDPQNLEFLKDLAFTYYLKKDYVSAFETAKTFGDRKDADVQAYQILALVYKALDERKECEKLYRAALKKFPTSGVLYNEYGEMLWTKKEFADAAKLWEKGIEMDPNNSGNYYNAAKFYYMSADKTWGLIYGEIFVNLESYSQRTVEIKGLLLEGYKKLFTGSDLMKYQNTKNEFVSAFLGLMQKHSGTVSEGVTPETLTTLRARFILDWYDKYAARFPFRLFEHHVQLLKMGFFDAYNQWIFGAAGNLTAYQQWTSTHADVNNEFTRLQKNRVFKVPTGQYYQTPASK